MYYRIQLQRSFIGLPKTIGDTCRSLGLVKRGRVVYQKVTPPVAGQVVKIKELVKVDVVDSLASKRLELSSRKSEKGYEVVGSL